jgi:inosine-uridine nucleoside N-ribohydrolase
MLDQVSNRKVIIDTDIGWMNDDCIAAIFALSAPSLEIVGINPVMGNYDLKESTAAALRMLEMTGHENVPVNRGCDRPLIHERGKYEAKMWGRWAMFNKNVSLPPGLPKIKGSATHAADFIIETVLANPGEITIVAVGPLTNLAIALRKEPAIVDAVADVVIMGGGFPMFPGGWGNSTPVAEFNFWVDPEAAKIVIRSALPMTLLPINVCRQTEVTREFVEQIVNSNTIDQRIAGLFRDYTLPLFASAKRENHLAYGLYDSLTFAYLIAPGLFKTTQLNVDVVTSHGPQYGMSIGYIAGLPIVDDENMTFPIEDNLAPMRIVTDVDFDGFKALFLDSIGA